VAPLGASLQSREAAETIPTSKPNLIAGDIDLNGQLEFSLEITLERVFWDLVNLCVNTTCLVCIVNQACMPPYESVELISASSEAAPLLL
jgi:hypothetical protein